MYIRVVLAHLTTSRHKTEKRGFKEKIPPHVFGEIQRFVTLDMQDPYQASYGHGDKREFKGFSIFAVPLPVMENGKEFVIKAEMIFTFFEVVVMGIKNAKILL